MKNFLLILSLLIFVGFFINGCSSKTATPLVQQQNTSTTSDATTIPGPATPTAILQPPGKILGPLDSIKELDDKVSTYKSGSNLTPEDSAANTKLKEDIIRGTFDISELSRIALDVHWNEISEKERSYFSSLMTTLLEKKAILSKEQVKSDNKPYHIAYKKEEMVGPDKKSALVFTILTVPSEKVSLNINYKLILTPTGWHIFDVIVDDASLVENYKFQFDTIIRKYGYPELVSRMEQKLKEME